MHASSVREFSLCKAASIRDTTSNAFSSLKGLACSKEKAGNLMGNVCYSYCVHIHFQHEAHIIEKVWYPVIAITLWIDTDIKMFLSLKGLACSKEEVGGTRGKACVTHIVCTFTSKRYVRDMPMPRWLYRSENFHYMRLLLSQIPHQTHFILERFSCSKEEGKRSHGKTCIVCTSTSSMKCMS